MGTLVQAIERALRDSASTQPETVEALLFDRKAIDAAIARLRRLLEASDGNAEESFRSFQHAVEGVVKSSCMDGLSASIDDFDFDAALVKLDEIARRCARNGDDQ